MKKHIIIAGIIFSLAFSLGAEQLSKIGVVNFTRIVQDYYTESAAWREIDAMRKQYEDGINNINAEIDQLRSQRLEAQRDDNQIRVLQLDERIFQRQEYMKEFHNVWSNRINAKIQTVSTSESFTSEIYTVIKYIAESQGYSVILNTQDPNILWYSQAVDVTDLVIERLKSRAR